MILVTSEVNKNRGCPRRGDRSLGGRAGFDAGGGGEAGEVAGATGDDGGLMADGGSNDDGINGVRGSGCCAGHAVRAPGGGLMGEDVAALEHRRDLARGRRA